MIHYILAFIIDIDIYDTHSRMLGVAYKYIHTCRMQYNTNVQINILTSRKTLHTI